MTATSDSEHYRHTFFGILNGSGSFWSPLAFDSPQAAREALERFISINPERFGSMLRTHKIVPVRIQLAEIEG
jgi:hypothetical protein